MNYHTIKPLLAADFLSNLAADFNMHHGGEIDLQGLLPSRSIFQHAIGFSLQLALLSSFFHATAELYLLAK